MSKVITALANLATKLDNAKLTKAADVLDSVNTNILKIVTAQYEGIQGYWVRNQRCWSNCYRQKRQATQKPAQEVWFECQKEYEASLGKDSSPWDKYANELPNLIKTASVRVQRRAFAEQERFHAKLWSKVAEGTDYPVAVFEAIDERGQEISNSILDQAIKVASVSADLKKKGEIELAKEAAKIATFLVKMSQAHMGVSESNAWINPKNWGQGIKEMVGGWTGNVSPQVLKTRLQRVLNNIENVRTRFPANMTKLSPEEDRDMRTTFKQLQTTIQGELQQLAKMTRNNAAVGKIYQQLKVPFDLFSQSPNIPSRRKALDRLSQAIQQASGAVGQLQLTQRGEQANPLVQQQQQQRQQDQRAGNPFLSLMQGHIQAVKSGQWQEVIDTGNRLKQMFGQQMNYQQLQTVETNVQTAQQHLQGMDEAVGNKPNTKNAPNGDKPHQENDITSNQPQQRPFDDVRNDYIRAKNGNNLQEQLKLLQEAEKYPDVANNTDVLNIVKNQIKRITAELNASGPAGMPTTDSDQDADQPEPEINPDASVSPQPAVEPQSANPEPAMPMPDTSTSPTPSTAAPRDLKQIKNEYNDAVKSRKFNEALKIITEAYENPKSSPQAKALFAKIKQKLEKKLQNMHQYHAQNQDEINQHLGTIQSPQQVGNPAATPKTGSTGKVFNFRKYSEEDHSLGFEDVDTAHGYNSPQEAAQWIHANYISQGKEAELARHGFNYKKPGAAQPQVTAPVVAPTAPAKAPVGSDPNIGSGTSTPKQPRVKKEHVGSNVKAGDRVRVKLTPATYQGKPEVSEADGEILGVDAGKNGKRLLFTFDKGGLLERHRVISPKDVVAVLKPGQASTPATGIFTRVPKDKQPKQETVGDTSALPTSQPVAAPQKDKEPKETADPTALQNMFEQAGLENEPAQTEQVAPSSSQSSSNTETYNTDEKKLESIIGKPLDQATPEDPQANEPVSSDSSLGDAGHVPGPKASFDENLSNYILDQDFEAVKNQPAEQTVSHPAAMPVPQSLPPSYENPQANEPVSSDSSLGDAGHVPGPKASIDSSSRRAADQFYDKLFDENLSNYILDQDFEKAEYGSSIEKLLESVISQAKEKISPQDLQKVNEFIQSKPDNNKFRQSRAQFREALRSMVDQYSQLIVGAPELAGATASSKERITYASLDSDAKKMLLKLKKGFER